MQRFLSQAKILGSGCSLPGINAHQQVMHCFCAEKIVGWALSHHLMQHAKADPDARLVLSNESIQYGVEILQAIQNESKSLKKSLKKMNLRKDFWLMSYRYIGVTFNDIGALEKSFEVFGGFSAKFSNQTHVIHDKSEFERDDDIGKMVNINKDEIVGTLMDEIVVDAWFSSGKVPGSIPGSNLGLSNVQTLFFMTSYAPLNRCFFSRHRSGKLALDMTKMHKCKLRSHRSTGSQLPVMFESREVTDLVVVAIGGAHKLIYVDNPAFAVAESMLLLFRFERREYIRLSMEEDAEINTFVVSV
ncbi:hypothetical protein L1987_20967 [Smallanthus sonchifolius]|uniref:Uncharacterized protein n=1 Tax=Smallanthus sonchifolius TaxID=185202 RepID=A0ACB9IUR9_9ASTR|nr:hypothetical protein L1987_20967 [Smallanthus sonchifolius]